MPCNVAPLGSKELQCECFAPCVPAAQRCCAVLAADAAVGNVPCRSCCHSAAIQMRVR